jgi:hypothetical protein
MLAMANFLHKNELIEMMLTPVDESRHTQRMKELYL